MLRWIGLLLVVVACGRPRVAGVEDVVARAAQAGRFSGVALVVRDGEVVLRKAYGGEEVGARFQIASVTKQFTAAVVLSLVDEGRLALDGTVERYLPEYGGPGRGVTIAQLLHHASGIPSYTGLDEWRERSRKPATQAEVVGWFSGLALAFEPGTRVAYSNSGYFLLGVIAERVAGRPLAEVMRERLFAKAGMRDTELLTDGDERVVRGREKLRNGRYEEVGPFQASTSGGEGAVVSTVDDLRRWDHALRAGRVLSAQSRAYLFEAGEGNYGAGWLVGRVEGAGGLATFLRDGFEYRGTSGARVAWHWGSNPGSGALVIRSLDRDGLIVLLENVEYIGVPGSTHLFELAAEVAEAAGFP